MQYVSFVISIIAFLLSVWNFATEKAEKRILLSCCLDLIVPYIEDGTNTFIIRLIINNKSKLPIAINRISLNCNKTVFEPVKRKTRLYSLTKRRGEIVTGQSDIYNSDFPIDIPGYCSASCYLCLKKVDFSKITIGDKITFEFFTGRGITRCSQTVEEFSNTLDIR